jgi:peptide/nickel transport system permease protein
MNKKKFANSDMIRFWKRYKRNRLAVFGLCFLALLIILALFANVIAPDGYDVQNYKIKFTNPNLDHPLGTDYLGRDNLVRMIYGARISLSIGVVTTLVGTVIAVFIGMLAGFYGGKSDNVLMRIMDIFLSIPSILLSIVLAAVFGGGILSMIFALSLSSIPGVARLVRAMVISERDKEYIEVARTSRATDMRIMFRYILPNISSSLIVLFTMGVAGGILNASTLSFLGLGAQAPMPEWGKMLSEGRNYIRDYPYLVLAPGMVIMLTVFSLNMIGDGLRDALDPRLKGR